jgi:succinoglycan biosynthesis transport protein ExoP
MKIVLTEDRGRLGEPTDLPTHVYPQLAPAGAAYFDLPPSANGASEWARFSELVRGLSRRKGLILLTTLFGCATAIGLSLWTTPVYRATTSLEVQGLNEDFLDLRNMDSAAKPTAFSMESYIQTQADILQDEVLLERVIGKLHLASRPSFHPTGGVRQLVARYAPASAKLRLADERPIDILKSNLLILPSRRSHIIQISYESMDRQLSADVANTLAEEFLTYNQEARLHSASEIGQWLGPKLQEMKNKLEQSEAELHTWSQAAGLMLTSGNETVSEENLRHVQRELATAQADRIAKQSLYEMASRSTSDSFPPMLDTAGLREQQVKLTELRRQYAELSSLYTPDNYRVARVQAQINELETARQREALNIPRRAKNDYDAALAREFMLAKTYEGQSALVTRQARQRIRYDTLKREVDTNRRIYEATLQKAEEAGVATAIKPSGVRIIGTAKPPINPYRPKLPLNLSLGMAMGLCAGLIGAAVLERNKRVLRAPGEMRMYVDLPELGAIPAANHRSLHASKRQLLDLSPVPGRLELVTWEEKRSAMSESFREVLASLLYSSSCRTLLIASAWTMEGKTTVVSNLGIALAEIGKRVLLIDGDLRKPRLHDIFDQPNTWGLSNLLAEKESIADLPANVLTRKTAIPGLCLLPSGPATDQISTLLYSPRVHDLMSRFRQEFDYVLLDAPPVFQFADARVLAHSVDAVALVIRANRTDPSTARAAVERFQLVGVPVLGTILNDWDARAGEQYGYRYQYGY